MSTADAPIACDDRPPINNNKHSRLSPLTTTLSSEDRHVDAFPATLFCMRTQDSPPLPVTRLPILSNPYASLLPSPQAAESTSSRALPARNSVRQRDSPSSLITDPVQAETSAPRWLREPPPTAMCCWPFQIVLPSIQVSTKKSRTIPSRTSNLPPYSLHTCYS